MFNYVKRYTNLILFICWIVDRIGPNQILGVFDYMLEVWSHCSHYSPKFAFWQVCWFEGLSLCLCLSVSLPVCLPVCLPVWKIMHNSWALLPIFTKFDTQMHLRLNRALLIFKLIKQTYLFKWLCWLVHTSLRKFSFCLFIPQSSCAFLMSGDRIMFILYLPQYVPGPFYFYLPYEPTSEGL